MTRWLSWLAELQPEMFCEVSPELAREKGLANGGWATIRTARAEIEARVLVTERMRPLRIRGRIVHQIGLPYHWGNRGCVTGDSANDLISFVADPNVIDSGVEGADRRISTGAAQPQAARGTSRRGRTGRRARSAGRGVGRSPGEGEGPEMPKGFFTDTTVCIGCKACEVACKQWNQLPDDGMFFSGHVLRQHGGPGRLHLAARRVHRAARAAGRARPTAISPG